jgi:DNA-binding NarL/FixJ family response regulator
MKKVLLAEDHSIVIKGMTIIFETEFVDYNFNVVSNSSDLMNALKKDRYQLAIIDLQLEDGDTLHLVTDILRLYPDLNILIFSGNPEELYAQKLYNKGVKGYLNKQTKDSEIIFALRQILDGKTYVSENFKRFLLRKDEGVKNPFDKLSPREMEVLNLMLQGKRSLEICRELNLQKSTVATYKAKLFTKLQITNVLELKQLVNNYKVLLG